MRWFRLLALRFARPEIEASQALDRERQARAALEVMNASLQRENEFLRQEFGKAVEAERRALHMVANIGMQSKYGITPYPDDPGLQENGELKPSEQIQTRQMQGVDMVAAARRTFVDDYKARAARGEKLPIPPDQIEQYVASL